MLFNQSLDDGSWPASKVLRFPGWMVEISSDHSCAFRQMDIFAQDPNIGLANSAKVSGKFLGADFNTNNLAELKASMHKALAEYGLYDDEATAMLKTWELSYFKSPGLRFFYIVPRAWVD